MPICKRCDEWIERGIYCEDCYLALDDEDEVYWQEEERDSGRTQGQPESQSEKEEGV